MLEGRPVFKVNYDSFTGRSLATHSTLVWLALLSFMFGALLYLATSETSRDCCR